MIRMKLTNKEIEKAGHAPDMVPRVRALCAHLDCGPGEVELMDHAHYGLLVYRCGSREYAIATDQEADEACLKHIEDSVWAFNASFILKECGLPRELEECIQGFQEQKCESANPALLALVEKCCKGGLDEFVTDAIAADGRGHFLSHYDGEESQEVDYYIYRVN